MGTLIWGRRGLEKVIALRRKIERKDRKKEEKNADICK